MVLSVRPVFASRAPDTYVYNETAKQCAVFVAGDEFSHVALPEGWKIFSNNSSLTNAQYQATCKNLGYEILEGENPMIKVTASKDDSLVRMLLEGAGMVLFAIVVYLITRQAILAKPIPKKK